MARLVAVVGAVLVLSIGAATVLMTTVGGPMASIPRTCWFSDYANARLSNQCDYNHSDGRWYMKVGSEMKPADEQTLPIANLCLYFYGTACPD